MTDLHKSYIGSGQYDHQLEQQLAKELDTCDDLTLEKVKKHIKVDDVPAYKQHAEYNRLLPINKEIRRLQDSPAWLDGNHRDHEAVVNRLVELHAMLSQQ